MDTDHPASDPFFHDAFISYSRKDTFFAAALERALKRYRPPRGMPVPQRRLNIFRDQEDFTGVEYSKAVELHLRGARKLIVICSPHASKSRYVEDEIRRFATSHNAIDIISVLLAGVPNNEAKPGDDLAFPGELCKLLEVPLASDYRGFHSRWHRPASRRFRPAWYKLLADLYERSRAEIEERERRRKFRQRVVWGVVSSVVAATLAIALYIADDRNRTAWSNELAGKALGTTRSNPELATLLSVEALKRKDTPAAVSALRVALAQLPDMQTSLPPGADVGSPIVIAFAPNTPLALIADREGRARIIDLQTGRTVLDVMGDGNRINSAAWSADGKLLATTDEDGNSVIYDATTGKQITKTDGELHWLQSAGQSGVPAVIVRGETVQLAELDRSGTWLNLREVALRSSSVGALSPDGHKMASLASDDARLTVTDLDSGRVMSRLLDVPSESELLWSSKGRYVVAHSLFGFSVIDARSLENVFSIGSGEQILVEDLSISPDEKRLAGTNRNGYTTLWEIETKEQVGELDGEETRAYTPKFSPDGKLLSVVYANGRARLFNANGTETGALNIFNAIAGEIVAADFTPDAQALVVQYQQGRLALWQVDRWQAQHHLPLEYGDERTLDAVRLTADGTVVAVQKGNDWRGWDTASGAEVSAQAAQAAQLKALPDVPLGKSQLHRLSHEWDVISEALSPDGACILTASAYRMASGSPPANANVVRLWEAGTATLLRQWNFDEAVRGPDAAFFAGRDRLVVLSDGAGFVYRTSLCEPLDALRKLAEARVSRALTPEEQATYLGTGPAISGARTAVAATPAE